MLRTDERRKQIEAQTKAENAALEQRNAESRAAEKVAADMAAAQLALLERLMPRENPAAAARGPDQAAVRLRARIETEKEFVKDMESAGERGGADVTESKKRIAAYAKQLRAHMDATTESGNEMKE
jgi:hypothetical protein